MKYVVWDFDGTLGYRVGPWSSTLLEVLEEDAPGVGLSPDFFRLHLRSGFPWHTPERAHPDLSSPDLWWESLEPVFRRAFEAIGKAPSPPGELAKRVREAYLRPVSWRLYDDTTPVLRTLSSRGWTHLLLTNHAPELGGILHALGLNRYIHRVFNSAESGYKKPHPRAFDGVLRAVRDAEAAWMVGDSLEADVNGAEAVGIPAILVRRGRGAHGGPTPDATVGCLAGVPALLSRRPV